MRREPFSHRTKIVRVNLAARFSHLQPHLMVVIGKLTNREIVVGVFSQDSLKYGHALLHWYQLVPVAEQKQRRHSHRPQCCHRIVIHLLREPKQIPANWLAQFFRLGQCTERVILLRFRSAKPSLGACLLQLRFDLFVSVPARHVAPNVATNRTGFSNIVFWYALSPQLICVINDHLFAWGNPGPRYGNYERHVCGPRSRQWTQPPSLAEPPRSNALRVNLVPRFQVPDRRKPIVTKFHERNYPKISGGLTYSSLVISQRRYTL